jgi:hypothetical protein
MFTSITWEIFFTTIIMIVGSYYGISVLLLYRREIAQKFKSQAETSFGSSLENSQEVHHPSDVMGGISKGEYENSPRTSIIESDEIGTVISDDQVEIIQTPVSIHKDDLLIGSVADLIEEIKTLIQLIVEYKSDRVETQSLFHALLIKYPHLLDTSYQDAISLYICEAAKNHLSLQLQVDEMKDWWKYESSKTK